MTDPLQHQSSRTYNADGTLASVTDAKHNTTQFGYDSGDLISVTDGNGNTSTQFTDAAGPEQNATALTYDGNGNLLTLADGGWRSLFARHGFELSL